MKDFADEVNSIGYKYRPVSQNSNSFAAEALQRGGFVGTGTKFPERFDSQLVFDPVSGETRSLYVPGFEKSLANPIDTETPMPFASSSPAAPFAPSNEAHPPDRWDMFAGRYSNWASSPTGIPPTAPARSLGIFQRSFWKLGLHPGRPFRRRQFSALASAGDRQEIGGS